MSTLTHNEMAANPSAPSAGKVKRFIDNTTTTPRAKRIDDAAIVLTEIDSSMLQENASVAAVSGGYATDTYLAGSAVAVPVAGAWLATSNYHCVFDMTKTAAGTVAIVITVRMGTLGTTGDAAIMTITFAVGTAAIDTGLFDIWINFRTVGSGTTAVIQAVAKINHHLAATGLTTTGASGTAVIIATSAGFNSTTQTILGLSFNGGASFLGTNTLVQAKLLNI